MTKVIAPPLQVNADSGSQKPNRRAFLAASLAAPAVAIASPGLSLGSAEPTSPAPPAMPDSGPPTWFYQWFDRLDDELYPDAIGGSLEAVEVGPIEAFGVSRRVRFVPLPTELRFALCQVMWMPAMPPLTEMSRPEVWKQWSDAVCAFPDPRTLVDTAPAAGYVEWNVHGDGLQTRENAFLECAGWNRDAIESAISEGRGRLARSEWHVVIEFGQPCPKALLTINLESNGVGHVSREMQWPCRLVQPTAAELAAYPLPAEWKGGAA